MPCTGTSLESKRRSLHVFLLLIHLENIVFKSIEQKLHPRKGEKPLNKLLLAVGTILSKQHLV